MMNWGYNYSKFHKWEPNYCSCFWGIDEEKLKQYNERVSELKKSGSKEEKNEIIESLETFKKEEGNWREEI
jgi:hypothetical protein